MNTAVSFATNTNWQSYGGETTLSYLTQMLGLTVQNFVSAATGMAVLVAMIRGFVRRIVADHRQLLVRPGAQHAVYPAAAVDRRGPGAGFAGRGADVRVLPEGDADPARQGRRRQGGDRADDRRRAGRLADRHQATRHQRRRLFQRQFGPSAGEPHAAGELRRSAVAHRDFRRAVLHLRQDGGRHAAGLGHAGGHAGALRAACCCWAIGRSSRATRRWPRSGVDQQRRSAPAGRKHGRQGSPLRHRAVGDLGGRHHGHLLRQRQLDARLLYAAGRPGRRCG